jgi:hypothetical protein
MGIFMRILTIVFYDDLHQLRMQALTLEKYWKGKRAWTIVIENRDPAVQQEQFEWIQQNVVPVLSNWDLDIVRGDSAYEGGGWMRQQIFKLYYSSLIQDDWVLILDAKNFLINSADESTFVNENGVFRMVTGCEDQFHKDLLEDSKRVVGVTEDIPFPSVMTPWVWNTNDLRSLFQHINFSKDHWPFDKATEFGLYWAWAYNKHVWFENRTIITGYWGNNLDDEKVRLQASSANRDSIFWVHHRYAYRFLLRELTAIVLERSGIKREDTNKWNKAYQYLIRHKKEDIMVEDDQRAPQLK